MKIFQKYKVVGLSLLVGSAILTITSCSQEGLLGKSNSNLTIDTHMSSTWNTRSSDRNTPNEGYVSDTVDIDNNLTLVVESMPRIVEEQIITRGTPITSVSQLATIRINTYGDNVAYTSATPFIETITGNYSGGAWSLSETTELDNTYQYTYMAYSPADATSLTNDTPNRKVIYTITGASTKENHVDLCWGIVRNNATGNASFAMSHALSAVGVKVCADNLEIKSISFTNIMGTGNLALENGAWSALTSPQTLSPTLRNMGDIGTQGKMENMTSTDGYMMVPPQLLSDGNKLIIEYRYKGETAYKTSTHQINDITRGSEWAAGQQIMYSIQFKAKFQLDVTPAVGYVTKAKGKSSFTCTTNSPNVNDPRISSSDTWVTNILRNPITGEVTFDYDANPYSSSRKNTFTIVSGFSTTTYTLTQLAEDTLPKQQM